MSPFDSTQLYFQSPLTGGTYNVTNEACTPQLLLESCSRSNFTKSPASDLGSLSKLILVTGQESARIPVRVDQCVSVVGGGGGKVRLALYFALKNDEDLVDIILRYAEISLKNFTLC